MKIEGAPRSGPAAQGRGLFTPITQALNLDDVDPEKWKATQTAVIDPVVDLRALIGPGVRSKPARGKSPRSTSSVPK